MKKEGEENGEGNAVEKTGKEDRTEDTERIKNSGSEEARNQQKGKDEELGKKDKK